ncbi:peptidoglycan recognition protein family protein [Streptomyces ambofaciens]|nr:peptidoglycan recognition protein [Streptomyces ambofaciens]
MRGFLASSIGVTCAAALALPLAPPAAATSAARPTNGAAVPAEAYVPGSTQSLPLTPTARDRAPGAAEQGVPRRDVRHFSLVGVVWDNPATELHGQVQVRTRATATGTWSGWQELETHNADHAADPDSTESTSGRVRGATAPLWVGESDGVEVRVRAESTPETPGSQTTTADKSADAATHDSADALTTHDSADRNAPNESADAPTTHDSADRNAPHESADRTTHHDSADAPTTEDSADAPTADALTGPGTTTGSTGPGTATGSTGTDRAAGAAPLAASPLPTGMRLELIDPGEGAPPAAAPGPEGGPRTTVTTAESAEALAASAVNAGLAPLGAAEIPALNRAQTEAALLSAGGAGALTAEQRAKPYVGPRPSITTRRGWGANEKLREKKFVYTKKVKAAFVHHSATGNNYTCSQAPSVIRSIYRYHVNSMGWRDVGYNFLVDKCGKIYEGRAGGVSKAVLGAHTMGFNSNSMGIAVLGTYSSKKPSSAAVKAIARLTAWKLGLYGMNPRGKTYLKSGGGNLYRKGKNVRLNVISGHRDGFATSCPGKKLYAKLGTSRSTAAKYQGR